MLNRIKIHGAKKHLTFTMPFSQKLLKLLVIFKKIGLISSYIIFNNVNDRKQLTILLLYYKNIPLSQNYKIISKSSKNFYISYNALRMLAKRTRNSVYLISTSRGLIHHHAALQNKIGGTLIGFFSV